jgi:hypothetical protein
MPRAGFVRATTSFACTVKDVEYLVHGGEVLPASHPAAKAHPELFEPERPVEQATAAPGEKRRR